MTNTQRQKSNTLPRPLRIFLSHISEDKPRVLQIYEWLKAFGTDPWLDKAKLTGGDKWEQRIKTEMKRSDLIIICLSESAIKKRGYFQVEITEALALAQREPEGFTLIIPVFLELCTLPDRLSSFHAVNLYEPSGVHNLVQALSKRANELPGVFFNTPEVVPELIIQLIH
jgi:TIR domain